jgi:hypothetical protein
MIQLLKYFNPCAIGILNIYIVLGFFSINLIKNIMLDKNLYNLMRCSYKLYLSVISLKNLKNLHVAFE